MCATTCSRFPASRTPASTSSTSPSGPQSACPKKRAGSWVWSSRRSGGARPDVEHASDDGFRLRAVLQVVDVSLAARDDRKIWITLVGCHARALALVPDVPRSQEGGFGA